MPSELNRQFEQANAANQPLDYLPPPPPPRPSSGVLRRIAVQACWTFFWMIFAAIGVGIVSPLLAGHFWINDILCHFQPQYAVGLLVLAVPLALCRRWKGLALVLGALGVAASVWIAPLYWGSAHAGPTKLRLLAANVDCRNPSPVPFLALVEAEQPDVILIFEFTRVWAKTVPALLEEKGYTSHAFLPSPGHSGSGIFSRYPLEDAKVQTVDPYPNFVPSARLTVGSKTLRVFGTHPFAPYTRQEMDLRNQQMASLAKLVGAESSATIVAGDFNTSSWSPCFTDFTRETGLRDTRRGFGVLTTFPTDFVPFRTTIDHCVVSPDLQVVDRRVGPDIGSDHLPILVDLTWND